MQEGNWDWLSEGAGCHWNGGNKKGQSRDRFPEKFGAGKGGERRDKLIPEKKMIKDTDK